MAKKTATKTSEKKEIKATPKKEVKTATKKEVKVSKKKIPLEKNDSQKSFVVLEHDLLTQNYTKILQEKDYKFNAPNLFPDTLNQVHVTIGLGANQNRNNLEVFASLVEIFQIKI